MKVSGPSMVSLLIMVVSCNPKAYQRGQGSSIVTSKVDSLAIALSVSSSGS